MWATLWLYRVTPEARPPFEAAYGPDGAWVELFRRHPAYRNTSLIRFQDGIYATLDVWTDADAFAEFKRHNDEAYAALDAACDPLTEEERHIMSFTL